MPIFEIALLQILCQVSQQDLWIVVDDHGARPGSLVRRTDLPLQVFPVVGLFHGVFQCRNRRIPVQAAGNKQAKTVYHDALLLD